MTRYAIDALTAVRLVREGITVPDSHQLVAPNVLRSQALGQIYRATRQGELGDNEAERMLEGITSMRIRLLGDRVSRRVAWRVASQLHWDDTLRAEYVAVAQLQADAFVTLDLELAREVAGIVPVVAFEEFAADLAGTPQK
jgi:predicted nucleic acid-binding protein